MNIIMNRNKFISVLKPLPWDAHNYGTQIIHRYNGVFVVPYDEVLIMFATNGSALCLNVDTESHIDWATDSPDDDKPLPDFFFIETHEDFKIKSWVYDLLVNPGAPDKRLTETVSIPFQTSRDVDFDLPDFDKIFNIDMLSDKQSADFWINDAFFQEPGWITTHRIHKKSDIGIKVTSDFVFDDPDCKTPNSHLVIYAPSNSVDRGLITILAPLDKILQVRDSNQWLKNYIERKPVKRKMFGAIIHQKIGLLNGNNS